MRLPCPTFTFIMIVTAKQLAATLTLTVCMLEDLILIRFRKCH